jgi:hypothetical protein
VTAYGQWTLTPPKERAELQPPLTVESPLMNPLDHCSRLALGTGLRKDPGATHDSSNEEQWLSQVEIVTHIGPHRRLWMGPQFSFKTFRRVEGGR